MCVSLSLSSVFFGTFSRLFKCARLRFFLFFVSLSVHLNPNLVGRLAPHQRINTHSRILFVRFGFFFLHCQHRATLFGQFLVQMCANGFCSLVITIIIIIYVFRLCRKDQQMNLARRPNDNWLFILMQPWFFSISLAAPALYCHFLSRSLVRSVKYHKLLPIDVQEAKTKRAPSSCGDVIKQQRKRRKEVCVCATKNHDLMDVLAKMFRLNHQNDVIFASEYAVVGSRNQKKNRKKSKQKLNICLTLLSPSHWYHHHNYHHK